MNQKKLEKLQKLYALASNNPNQNEAIVAAHKFINANKEWFRQICDIAEADPDYVAELHDDLTYHYNCGKLKNFNIKIIIEKLIEKIFIYFISIKILSSVRCIIVIST